MNNRNIYVVLTLPLIVLLIYLILIGLKEDINPQEEESANEHGQEVEFNFYDLLKKGGDWWNKT